MQPLSEDLRSYIAGLRRYALSLTSDSAEADDLVQETLERALQMLRRGRRIDNLRAYLFTILHNLRASQARRRGNGRDHVPIEDVADQLPTPGNQHHTVELKRLFSAMDALPMEQKSVLLLVCVEGFTYREAADVLDIPIGTVMSRLSRARRTLMDDRDREDAAPTAESRG